MDFREHAQQLTAARSAFEVKYRAQYPIPGRPSAEGLRWTFFFALVWATVSVLAMSIGTQSEFYKMALAGGVSPSMAVTRSYLFMGAIEGGLLMSAALHGYYKKTYPIWMIWVGTGLCFLVSATANFNISASDWIGIGLVLDRALAIVAGPGAAFLALLAGEVAGVELANLLTAGERADRKLEVMIKEYNEAMDTAWKSSPEYAIVMADLRVAEQDHRAMVDDAKRSRKRSQPVHVNKGVFKTERISQIELAQEWLVNHPERQYWTSEDQVPQAREIAAALQDQYNRPFSTGSTHKARKLFLGSNGAEGGE